MRFVPEDVESLALPLDEFELYAHAWSPDGSTIAFVAHNVRGAASTWDRFFVVNADGSDVRPVPGLGQWSPDSSMIAFERDCPIPDRVGAVIVVHDLVTGSERVLEATTVDSKVEGTWPAPRNVDGACRREGGVGLSGRAWDYEGWSWSPDSRSIVMLERRGERPIVVDVETGEATEVPWEAESAPSWQRPRGP